MIKRYKNFKRDRKYKKDINLMRELIEYDVKIGSFKVEECTVNKKIGGCYALCNIKQDEIIEYILMPIGEVDKIIPINYKEDEFNKSFYKLIDSIKSKYRIRLEKEMNNRDSKRASRYAFISIMVGIATLIATIMPLIIPLIIPLIKK